MNDLERGWLAGIIDGEGSVMLLSSGGRRGNRIRWRSPVVSVASTDLEIISECKRICNDVGYIIFKKARNKCKESWSWRVKNDSALAILTTVCDLLKCPKKKSRARYILDNYKKLLHKNGCYSDDEKLLKKQFEEDFFKLS